MRDNAIASLSLYAKILKTEQSNNRQNRDSSFRINILDSDLFLFNFFNIGVESPIKESGGSKNDSGRTFIFLDF